ncbi:PKD domain-containing protein [Echinicola soli]|uniref:PKD domain-containing protein n=1 Tax=Echinicola soli TaxID=2591634 RepID=A0A514CHC0_9BACT|nr:PKD domain-containing protein [Echinicola soli]QDH79221.1 PKD domain-containing protein [Echinicola soli]
MLKSKFVFALLLFISVENVFAQNSTIGKEFWLGFMENFGTEEGLSTEAVVIITADERTSGTINYLGRTTSFDLEKSEQFILRINSDELDLFHRNSGRVENKGVYISASGNIAVHAFNEMLRTADGTVVLPVSVLGRDYYITTHKEVTPFESTLLVVAIEDNTEIEITPAVNTINGKTAGEPFTVILNRGQSYQVKADGDLTGSRARVVGGEAENCKKIAAFGGSKCTWVGNCEACDVLYQQAYAVSSWGKRFVHIALKERTSGELVKVLASEDGTMVSVDGVPKGTINKGKFMTLNFTSGQSAKIETTKPASVTMFSKGVGCNDPDIPSLSGIGDPFMITYSPSEQFLKELSFNSIQLPSISNHYVNIVVKSGSQGDTRLDGRNIGGAFSPLPGDQDFQIAQINVSEGVHRLVNPDGFAAYVYGFGFRESYGFAAGASLDNLNVDIESAYSFAVEGEKVACLGQEGIWRVIAGNPNFNYFLWDFGDGSPALQGKEVTHQFDAPGTYRITVSASSGANSCDGIEEATFEVEVVESIANLTGNSMVCPEVEEVMYYIEEKEHLEEATFQAIGGEVLENYGDSVLVRWGKENADAKLVMNPYSENGCPGKAVEFNVNITSSLMATAPVGQTNICFDPEVPHIYFVENPVKGRKYEWEIEAGDIVSGQGSPEVEIVWNEPGVIGEVGYTVYGPEGNTCSGVSPKIAVSVAEELAEVFVTDVDCAGNETGEIQIRLAKSPSLHTFIWNHDPALNEPIAENLGAGSYSVIIIDQNGCSQSIETIAVKEHAPEVRMPTGFAPGQPPHVYQGVSACEFSFELWVYNRWGSLMYYGKEGWDGRFNDKLAPIGTYAYILRYNYPLYDKTYSNEIEGVFTLVR